MKEVVVIGGGIAGFCAALALWERGAAVTIVESTRPGAEATGASAGMLAAQFEALEPGPRFRFCLESRTRYPRFVEKLEKLSRSAVDVRWGGMLVANFGREEHERAAETAHWQRESGLAVEVVPPDQAAAIQPGVSQDPFSYVWLPDEGWLDSQKLASALADALARTAIRLIAGNPVKEIREEDGRVTGVVTQDARAIVADVVVVAAGAWSPHVGGLPRRLPVRPVRGQILRFQPGDGSLTHIVAGHDGSYLVPRADGTLLAGSTMEEVGFDRSITDAGGERVRRGVERLFPGLMGRRPMEHWAGLRPISADSNPIIGPDPDLAGLLIATAYGRDGILMGPLAGEVVARLAMGEDAGHDLTDFRPDRFDRTDSNGLSQ